METTAVEKCRRLESCSEDQTAPAPTPHDHKCQNALLQACGKKGACLCSSSALGVTLTVTNVPWTCIVNGYAAKLFIGNIIGLSIHHTHTHKCI